MGGCYLTLQIATTGRTSYLGQVEPFPLFSLFFKRGERFYRLHAWLQQQANTLCYHLRYVVSTFLPLASMSDIHTNSVPPKTLGHKQMLPHSNTVVTCQAPWMVEDWICKPLSIQCLILYCLQIHSVSLCFAYIMAIKYLQPNSFCWNALW